MKVASYEINGQASFGVVSDDGIIDGKPLLGGKCDNLRQVLDAGALGDLQSAAAGRSPDHKLADITYLPPITNPDKIFAIGLNYKTHIEEGGPDRPTPKEPMVFTRYPNSHVGHLQPMIRPKVSEMFDFEGELAVIIGKTCRHVAEKDYMSVIAGYSCYNDGSVRDYQRHTTQFTPGKNFYHSGAFGPWLVTTDEIPDPSKLTLMTRLNGEEMQRAETEDLLFGVPKLINYLSTVTELYPGDVIATGTCGGVGFWREPKLFMKAGDTIEVEFTGVGLLANPIEDE